MPFDTFDLVAHFGVPEQENSFSASNPPKVLLVLSQTEDKDLLESFLPKILQAVKIDMQTESLSIIHSNYPINILDQIKDLGVKNVISFGVSPKDLTLNLNPQLYTLLDISKVKFLFADKLDVISKQQDRKKLLWNHLQTIFLTAE